MTLDTSVQYLKGVGEKRAASYRKLQIETIYDLLHHFPRDYIDLSTPYLIAEAPLMENCAIRARLIKKLPEQRVRSGLSLFKMRAEDQSGIVDIVIFNNRYTAEVMRLDEEYIFYGKMGGTLLKREMLSPTVYSTRSDLRILPVYPQTAGIHSRLMRRNIAEILQKISELEDPLPMLLRKQVGLMEYNEALHAIHFPSTLDLAQMARERFAFEELFVLALALLSLQSDNASRRIEPMRKVSMDSFFASLPYSPTTAQKRCIEEATSDLMLDTPMNRLVQGDVGSGKTLVATACVYFVSQNKQQSVILVPTEILAEQHYSSIGAMLSPFGVCTAILTGSTKAAEKREVLAGLADGSIDLCVGTHALLSEGIDFKKLGLVVTDEQHRFGVAQRASLPEKNANAHVLVMSATPIPRTLSLIIYGDLRLSIVDELPPGRQRVETLLINGAKRERAMNFICKALDEGRQAYIVCPLVEQGETDTGLRPAVQYAKSLAEKQLSRYRVGLLHGRMKAKDKEATMRAFKNGEIQVLVSTTVVEVGVDVPNASIILIENAERFGLSQLHQLRGRVGRGKHKSYCILVSDTASGTTRERLAVMKRTFDGFEVAEHDLQLRGPGDFFGQRQHGLPELRVASLTKDVNAMQLAQEQARLLLAKDPALSFSEHALLKQAVQRMLQVAGERPN